MFGYAGLLRIRVNYAYSIGVYPHVLRPIDQPYGDVDRGSRHDREEDGQADTEGPKPARHLVRAESDHHTPSVPARREGRVKTVCRFRELVRADRNRRAAFAALLVQRQAELLT